MIPSLTQLHYIVMLYKLQHFGKSAQACFVTQPTLSMQIKKVEEELGFIIFDRRKNPIKPTPRGKKLISHAIKVLSAHQTLLQLQHTDREEIEGELCLGIIPTLATSLTPLFLSSLASQYPNLFILQMTQ